MIPCLRVVAISIIRGVRLFMQPNLAHLLCAFMAVDVNF